MVNKCLLTEVSQTILGSLDFSLWIAILTDKLMDKLIKIETYRAV